MSGWRNNLMIGDGEGTTAQKSIGSCPIGSDLIIAENVALTGDLRGRFNVLSIDFLEHIDVLEDRGEFFGERVDFFICQPQASELGDMPDLVFRELRHVSILHI